MGQCFPALSLPYLQSRTPSAAARVSGKELQPGRRLGAGPAQEDNAEFHSYLHVVDSGDDGWILMSLSLCSGSLAPQNTR